MKAQAASVLVLIAVASCDDGSGGADGGDAPASDAATSSDSRAPGDAGPDPGTYDEVWGLGFGGSDGQWPKVAVDGGGNVFVAGFYSGTADFGGIPRASVAGSRDGFIAKYQAGGMLMWVESFGGGDNDGVADVAVDELGNVFVAGWFTGNAAFDDTVLTADPSAAFIAKLDAVSGAFEWVYPVGTEAAASVESVAADGSGGVAIGGSFSGTFTSDAGTFSGGGGREAFAARYDDAGSMVAAYGFGGPGEDRVIAVDVDGAGRVRAAGTFDQTVPLGGVDVTSAGQQDIFLLGLDADGAHEWSKAFGSEGMDFPRGLAVDSVGRIILVGDAEGIDLGGGLIPSGPVMARFSAEGSYQSSSATPAPVPGLAVAPGDDIVIAGSFDVPVDLGGGTLTGDGNDDIYVARWRSDGSHVWSSSYLNDDWVVVVAADVGPGGRIAIVGRFAGTITFGAIDVVDELGGLYVAVAKPGGEVP